MIDEGNLAADPDPTALFSKKHFERYMCAQWSKKGETLGNDARLGISIADLVQSSIERNGKLEAPYLDLWIAILDEFNSWLVSLLSTVYLPPEQRDGRMSDFERSVVVLLGKLIADFDGSARTLLRSITEYVHVLVALIDDPGLAPEFVAADTPETANAFYFQQLARGKLHRRLEAAWADFFQSSGEAARWFADQQRRQGTLLSGTAHPSFVGGTQAVMGFIETGPDENWLGHWGAKSNMSVLTISLYADAFLPLVLLSDYPFSATNAAPFMPIVFDPEDEMHRHVQLGRSVLASLILSLNKESNIGHIYPPGFEPLEPIEDVYAGVTAPSHREAASSRHDAKQFTSRKLAVQYESILVLAERSRSEAPPLFYSRCDEGRLQADRERPGFRGGRSPRGRP